MTTTAADQLTSDTDERIGTTALLPKLLKRPEFGSIVGAIAIFIFFSAATENFFSIQAISAYANPAATLGIMAVAVALLMIGGEFDLSAGAMIGFIGMMTALLINNGGLAVWLSMLITLALAVCIGAFNGLVVTRTRLPSFIVTLGTFFIVQGLGLGLARAVGGTTTIFLSERFEGQGFFKAIFASTQWEGVRIPVFYWIAIAVVATRLLLRTKVGNWIFSVGGDPNAANAVGVPVVRVKIALFINVSAMAWLVAMFNTFRFESAQIGTGVGSEFEFIIAAVIGGCLLTGGYGSAIGAAIGALMFEMVRQGLAFARWEADWFKLFLGILLLLAALLNQLVRSRAEKART